MMPSRYSHVTTAPTAPLSEIIGLAPEKEPWCVGYAHSQGHRYHARTNVHGRRLALMLLNEGTKELQAARNIDDLLEDIAPHVLCTRFHQNQASDLIQRWKTQVSAYLDSQVAPAYTRPVKTSSRMMPDSAEADMEERIAVVQQQLCEPKRGIRRLTAAQSSPPIAANLRRDEGRNTRAVVNSGRGSESSENAPVPRVRESSRRDVTESSTNQSAGTVPRPALSQASRQTSAASISSPRPVIIPTVTRIFGRTGSMASGDETSQLNRREIEGECGICLCDFHPSQAKDRDEEESDDSGDDDDKKNDYESLEELVWCKARCGVNFHKQCIDQWLGTAPVATCPACRSDWKH
ncbi:hypothetical protein N7457_000118 [Penicillium paradoxum]|uniref:uncharacterized protein n=1 Tax=Penicillium paradoxum TaxID=176176 RepID=UPI002546952B|nr:uncharacterized protein N7457_000118 [Penicillium paradoxum]KAJ5793519.1 hypothetical protein N7457_000118 [Penicillium paradoxum]